MLPHTSSRPSRDLKASGIISQKVMNQRNEFLFVAKANEMDTLLESNV